MQGLCVGQGEVEEAGIRRGTQFFRSMTLDQEIAVLRGWHAVVLADMAGIGVMPTIDDLVKLQPASRRPTTNNREVPFYCRKDSDDFETG